MTTPTALLNFLSTLNIEHQTISHPAVFTVAEAALIEETIPGAHTKNLFLKDDRKQFWLISALQDSKINLRELSKSLPAKNLRFAQPELLREHLKVEPGSVTWFALINDKEHKVNAILDEALFEHDLVGFHPLENTATTIVHPQALITFAEALDHNYQLYDFKTQEIE